MSLFRRLYLMFLFFSFFIVAIIQPSPSKATNFFKWLSQHNKQVQQPPQIIKQKTDKLQKKIVTQKSAQKLKNENAKRILVIGDFIAYAVADALKKFFTNNRDIIIINKTKPASGLVRTDYYSWQNNISKLIDQNNPDVIIMMIGANDNQTIKNSDSMINTNQSEWVRIYKQRIIEIAENLQTSGKSWIWIGQPAFRSDLLTQKMKVFNALYKQETETAGGYFLDIWNGFSDKEGNFSFSGYGINGEIVKLRTNNGMHFTPEGKEKLVSYLQKPLKNILNFHTFSHEDPHSTDQVIQKLIQKSKNQEPSNIIRQPPISLDNMAQQNTHLLGKRKSSFIEKSWFPLNGYQKDRADNFSFP
ncbi:SGNH/GDSL hydrolase family protein [Bartonella rattimassiliensis]|uniref:SGNH/GDSL hydrolase family protein n=1 Tax=Bartonella rattimassiliensis TaxID=270250 RepID=UPI0002F74AD0|nr:SGNH family hydrolase [Bartonella rattimassiliensis]